MKELKSFLSHHRPLIFVIVATAISASLLEGFGLSLVIPLFEGIKGQQNPNIPFPLNQISHFINDLDFKIRIQIVALLMVVATVLKGGMVYLSNVSSYRLQMMVVKHYRMRCFRQLTNVGMEYINSQKNAHLQTMAITH